MKTVLVTGGTGFIGRWTWSSLLDAGFDVHLIGRRSVDRPLPQRPRLKSEVESDSVEPHMGRITFHACDLHNADQVRAICQQIAPTHLLHLAWYTEHGKFWSAPVNLDHVASSLTLLRAFEAVGGKRAVMAGTCAEYDWSGGTCEEGSTPTRPGTLYGVAKNALRELVAAHAKQSGLSWAWGRIFFLYGPQEDARRFLPSIAGPLAKGQAARCLFAAHERDFLHVEDIARAFVQVLDSELTGPINIASGEAVTLGSVARRIADRFQAVDRLELKSGLPTPENPARIVARAERLRYELGWRPIWTLERGLEAFCAEYAGQPSQEQSQRAA